MTTQTLNLNMTGNTVDNNGTVAGGGMGLRAVFSDTSTLNATIGDATAGVAANSFSGNHDAGVGIIMSGLAAGNLTVENSQFNNSVNGSDTHFAGVGLGISLIDSASLNPIVIGNANPTLANVTMNGNASDGLSLTTTSAVPVASVTVQNFTANENGGNGLNFTRQGVAEIQNVAITGGTINANTGHGINVTAADNNVTDNYVLSNNTITNNTGSGVRLNLVGDGDLNVTMTGNTISNNHTNGIQTTTTAGLTDTPTIVLTIGDGTLAGSNTINGNTGNGIFLNTTPHFAAIDTNTISGNTGDGININSSSAFFAADQIVNNTITLNGGDGINISSSFLLANIASNVITSNGDDGIAITSSGSGQDISIDSNLVQSNTGDGIQISANSFSSNNYSLTTNDVLDNGRRGLNFVNGFGASTSLTIGDGTGVGLNTFARNGLEGLYIVNTASNTQGDSSHINNLASAAMQQDGSLFTRPLLNLTMDDNEVNSNGQLHGAGGFIDGSGLVLRVGSSDGSNSFTDDGGFATTRGGVIAVVNNNNLRGDYASDVTFQAFISTVLPAVTGGSWTDNNDNPRNTANDAFTVTGYQSDPLSRLDLTFTNNQGDALVASNSGNSTAFYNTAEAVFKSRTQSQDGNDPPDGSGNDDGGPFVVGNRARNATREAFRGGAFSDPSLSIVGVSGNSDSFLYPGVGSSTFRVKSTSDTTGFAIGNDNFGTGIGLNGTFTTGELPFVWGTFP
jgi:hypothetical protein